MDVKQRSPSFLEVNYAKPNATPNTTTSTGKKKSPKSQIKFKAVPTSQLLQSLKMLPTEEQPSTTKKINIKAVRTTELNLDEFTKPPAVTTNSRNVRKQLWSANKEDNKGSMKKNDKVRRGTTMKPPSFRKTVYSRASLTNGKKCSLKKQSHDDTLPLMDMDQFTVTKIKRTLFPAQQSLNQRKTISHMSLLSKKPIVAKVGTKMAKPKIVITPAAVTNTKKSDNTNSNKNKSKLIEKDKKDETIELLFKKLEILENKLKAFDDVKKMLKVICDRFEIEIPENISPTNNDKISQTTKFDEVVHKLSPFISKLAINDIPCPSRASIHNEDIQINYNKLPPFISKLARNDIPCPSRTSIHNEEIKINEKPSPEKACTPKIKINEKPSPEKACTPKIQPTIKQNKTESTLKLKKTWITQFEQLENKLLNNSNISIHLNSSPDDSPLPVLHLDEIVKKTDLKIKKSQSTSNLTDDKSPEKRVLFKNKETDILTESICVYNQLRDEMKFLSTPINNKTMNFITPSVHGNEKKFISRRVQEQLSLLNDC